MGLDAHIREVLAADVAASMADQTAVLEFGHQTVPGTSGPPVASADVTEEGVLGVADLEWVGRVSGFPRGLPKPRDLVKVDGTAYWVENATDDGACLTLELRRAREE